MSDDQNSSDKPSDAAPYIVTRGKPPRETQFKLGKSGNPKGRPKGTKSQLTLLEEILDQKIEVTEGGRTMKLPRRKVMLTQLVNKAMRGDHRAIAACMTMSELRQRATTTRSGKPPEGLDTDIADDDAILTAFLARSAGDGDE